MKYKVYGMKCPFCSRVMYVGQTINLDQRIAFHNSSNGYYITATWIDNLRRLGYLPDYIIIAESENKEQALALEKKYIKEYASQGITFNRAHNPFRPKIDIVLNLIKHGKSYSKS